MRTNFTMVNLNIENQNITMTKGDTLSFGVECSDQHDNMIEFDTAFFTCKKNLTDETYLFQKSLGDGISLVDSHYVVRVAPEDTENAVPGRYYYDMQVGVGDDIYTIIKGALDIDFDVT